MTMTWIVWALSKKVDPPFTCGDPQESRNSYATIDLVPALHYGFDNNITEIL